MQDFQVTTWKNVQVDWTWKKCQVGSFYRYRLIPQVWRPNHQRAVKHVASCLPLRYWSTKTGPVVLGRSLLCSWDCTPNSPTRATSNKNKARVLTSEIAFLKIDRPIIYALTRLLLSTVLGPEFVNSMFWAGGNSGVRRKFLFSCIPWFGPNIHLSISSRDLTSTKWKY